MFPRQISQSVGGVVSMYGLVRNGLAQHYDPRSRGDRNILLLKNTGRMRLLLGFLSVNH